MFFVLKYLKHIFQYLRYGLRNCVLIFRKGLIILKLAWGHNGAKYRQPGRRISLAGELENYSLLLDEELLRELDLAEFVCLDFETTGLEAGDAEIIEIGAIRVQTGKIADAFDHLVGISKELPEAITHLTGIRSDDLRGQPPIEKVLPELLDFLGNSRILAHNLPFDFSFLHAALDRCGLSEYIPGFDPASPLHLDLLPLARIVFPRMRAYNLEALIAQFGIQVWDRHRALADAFAEIQVLEQLLLGALALPEEALQRIVLMTGSRPSAFGNLFRKIASLRQSHRYRIPPEAEKLRSAVQSESCNLLLRHHPRPDSGDEFDPDAVLHVFEPDGELASGLVNYEYRDEQVDMARSVCQAYLENGYLIVEAGTGTGKSWAYLVPAIFWSQAHPLPAGKTVVSTNTKNLQEQIFYKDLPYLHARLSADFQAVLLKGRNNYLCLDRWEEFWRSVDFATDARDLEAAMVLAVWQAETATGDVEEASGFQANRNIRLWAQIRSEGYACKGNACTFKDQCYVQRVRQAAKTADIVVVNHSLLLSDLMTQHKILGDYQNLIIDEAHNFENVATEYLGKEWSRWSLQNPLQYLAEKGDSRSAFLKDLNPVLVQLAAEQRQEILQVLEKIGHRAAELIELNAAFFARVSQLVLANRFTERDYARKIRYKSWLNEFPNLEEYSKQLRHHLNGLLERLKGLLNRLAEIPVRGVSAEGARLWEQGVTLLQEEYEELANVQMVVRHLLFETGEDYVRWIEPVGGRDSTDVRFRSAPLDVAPLLYELLFKNLEMVVFTSATLSVAGSFEYFSRRLGISQLPAVRRLQKILGSPFDYRKQVRGLIPQFLPNPKLPEFVLHGSQVLFEVLRAARRSTLVLFTSYQMLDQVYRDIRQRLQEEDLAVIAQGRSGSRNNLLRMLREGQAQVLLGTQSFWEGVDLPGDALEMLVITKLPFEVPSEPVIQARMEKIEQDGGNSFYQYTVPNAVLKFRQGFGRLIRSREDRGIVLLLDTRIVSTRYGGVFYQSLPVEPEVLPNLDELLERVVDWFSTA